MRLLLHACCGPCSAGVLPALASHNIHPVLYWNNPNIQPATEYLHRLDSLRTLCEAWHVPLVVDGTYGLKEFTKAVCEDISGRCWKCYAMRLDAAAGYAAQNGFDSFSTTLLVSPYQKHETIRQMGEQCAKKHGISFYYEDFRPGFREGQSLARDLDLYMQKYCGCVFSEEDRYQSKLAKEKNGFFPNVPPDPAAKRRRHRISAQTE